MTTEAADRAAARNAQVRRADIRFVAPELPRRAAVGDREWRAALEAVGLDVVRLDEPAPFAVASAGGEAVLRAGGYETTDYVLRPSVDDPALVLPRAHRAATGYALLNATGSSRGWRRLRNRAGAVLVRHVALPATTKVVVGLHRPGAPAFVHAAADFGVPESSEWFMTLGRGDELSRNAFFLFPPRESEPAWALKFVRVAGYTEPFDRDQHGLELAQSEPTAAAHAPRLLGRFAVQGLNASLETAAVGQPMRRLLEGSASRSAKLAVIDAVAEWIVALGAHTFAPPATLGAERARLVTEVLPHWRELGATDDIVAACADVGAVLQHNDLGTWNLLVDGASFSAIDWEGARRHGLPLWDLAYFLVDAFATLDRVSPPEWRRYVAALFRGEQRHSSVVLSWIRRGAEAAQVPVGSVGSVVLSGWLHHGLSHKARGMALTDITSARPGPIPRIEQIASIWLTEPGLGAGWSRWRDA